MSVSLRFCTAEARRLGVDGHVCELQLNLAAFAACLVRTQRGVRISCMVRGANLSRR